MRVTGGRARGIQLEVPKRSVRPALDRMREAVFSIIGSRVSGATFLDLFAGCGSYGLEALSRGADNGVFVEKNRICAKSVRRNLSKVCKSIGISPDSFMIFEADVFRWRRTEGRTFDLIFVDPPYDLWGVSASRILRLVGECLNVESQSRVVFESPGGFEFDFGEWTLEREVGNPKNRAGPTVKILKR